MAEIFGNYVLVRSVFVNRKLSDHVGWIFSKSLSLYDVRKNDWIAELKTNTLTERNKSKTKQPVQYSRCIGLNYLTCVTDKRLDVIILSPVYCAKLRC